MISGTRTVSNIRKKVSPTLGYPLSKSNLPFFLAQQPPVGQGLLIHEVSISHTTTHHSL